MINTPMAEEGRPAGRKRIPPLREAEANYRRAIVAIVAQAAVEAAEHDATPQMVALLGAARRARSARNIARRRNQAVQRRTHSLAGMAVFVAPFVVAMSPLDATLAHLIGAMMLVVSELRHWNSR